MHPGPESRGLLAATCALVLAGCAEWPRWSHVPPSGDAIDAPDDPRALVEREWEVIPEGPDLPDGSVGATARTLDREHAAVFEGALAGLGWNDLAPVALEIAPGCNDTGAARHPEVVPGEWTGDVDIVVVVAPEGGALCAEIHTDSTEAGWDLLLARLDACGVPAEFAEGEDGPLGWARGGAQGRWDAPLEAGVPYAVTLAAYWPTAPDNEVAYRLGLSLVADEGDVLCPVLPEGSP